MADILGSTLYREIVQGRQILMLYKMHIIASVGDVKFYIFGPIRGNIKR